MVYELNKCIIPSAGYGTRMFPVTAGIPKELLAVGTVPLLQHAVAEASEAGLKGIEIVTSRDKEEAFKRYFGDLSQVKEIINGSESKQVLIKDLEELIQTCKFNFPIQREMKGLGHAILQAKDRVGNNPSGVILPDDYCTHPQGEGVMKQLRTIYERNPEKSVIGLMEVSDEDVSKYGIIVPDSEQTQDGVVSICGMIEKPIKEYAPSNLAIVGRYILHPRTFEQLDSTKPDKSGEIQLTNALHEQAQDGNVLGVMFQGERFDGGNERGLRMANAHGLSIEDLEGLLERKRN